MNKVRYQSDRDFAYPQGTCDFLPIRRGGGGAEGSDLGKFRLPSTSNDDEPISPRIWGLPLAVR